MKLITVILCVQDKAEDDIVEGIEEMVKRENDPHYRGFCWRTPIKWHSVSMVNLPDEIVNPKTGKY